ncbi:Beta-hexosaminidase [Vibrio hippocampi]|uniref:Beta-hexosaminidase n=2 Tax=Vibrio hippocampi TaxID=654686 RepID=A0ABN8DMF6_9VIBR|nr:Beta-hexosaminidase [Vibrio hippocampi]
MSEAQNSLVVISRQAAREGIVLLQNRDQILPVTSDDKLALFGRCQIDTYRSGTGSGGAVNVNYAVNAVDGLRANASVAVDEELATLYHDWVAKHPFDDGGGGWASEPWFQHEMPLDDLTVQQAALRANKAVVFIGRTAGEDQDNADQPGSYRLTDLELAMLSQVTHHFEQVVVVLNTTNIMDMSWLTTLDNSNSIKAVLYSWAAGMEGGHALADILSGDFSPSGRLTDSIAYNLSDYPSSANFGHSEHNCYAEDIYVGYRYFETFKPEAVQFPFGAGLSYTEFEHHLVNFSATGIGAEKVLHFDISVRNIGVQFASKEVVQLYLQAPQGLLGRPTRALIGFVKTDTIEPGQAQQLRLSVPVASMAAYDDAGQTGHLSCYVLEAGEYHFYLGGNVRSAKAVDAIYDLEQLLVVEQLQEACAPKVAFKRMHPLAKESQPQDGRQKDSKQNYRISYQPVALRQQDPAEYIIANLPQTMVVTGDKGIKLIDVKQGRADLASFVAQMTPAELATIVRGEGMCSPKVTPGTASAFGGVSDSLFELGIPVACAADGPSGIRMDSGHKATQIPIGTLLGCTWNQPLNEALLYLVGMEMRSYQIDTLLGPGINIHRHPLNGRNFEYFSEDPLITGAMAAAQCRGLARAGVTGTLKHYAGNDQESYRQDVDAVVSERALREIHIKPFEMAVKQGNARSIMTAYNPVNGYWAASNYDLNTRILREEWGFDGIVMTDWWAKMNHAISGGVADKTYTSAMVRSQNDLYMVVEHEGAERNAMHDDTLQALQQGELTLGELQRSAMNICRFLMDTPAMQRPLVAYQAVKSIAPLSKQPEGEVFDVAHPLVLQTKRDQALSLIVDNKRRYRFSAQVSLNRNSLAQSTCSLMLNGEFLMTFSVHGTDGESVMVEGLEVELSAGFYTLDIVFVKPGLKLEKLLLN